MPCCAMKAAESGPPKPALALLASRATLKSVALIHSRTFQRSHSQWAQPMWSGCMWVTITRSTGRPPSTVAKIFSQAARVAGSSMPLSTMVQPWRTTPSSSISSRSSQRLMWSSWNGRPIRSQCTPGATSIVAPRSGSVSPKG